MPSSDRTDDEPRGDTPTQMTDPKQNRIWKPEGSSLWSTDDFYSGWFSNPGNVLLLTSVPFFAGAYFGYRMPTERLEDLIQGSTGVKKITEKGACNLKSVNQDAIRTAAARTASKALRIATLGTVGTFGLVTAVGFHLSGYNSLRDAVEGTKTWGNAWGKSLEEMMGGDQAGSKTHPEVLATRHLSGEEQLKYIYDNYIKEDEDEDILSDGTSDPTIGKDTAPTLYSIYEKYFKRDSSE